MRSRRYPLIGRLLFKAVRWYLLRRLRFRRRLAFSLFGALALAWAAALRARRALF